MAPAPEVRGGMGRWTVLLSRSAIISSYGVRECWKIRCACSKGSLKYWMTVLQKRDHRFGVYTEAVSGKLPALRV